MSSLSITLTIAQQTIIRYVYSSHLVLGAIGLSLNVIVLNRRQFRGVSCYKCKFTFTIDLIVYILLSSRLHECIDSNANLFAFQYCTILICIHSSQSNHHQCCILQNSYLYTSSDDDDVSVVLDGCVC